jgi:Cu2+-exporting ATPase
MSGALARRGVLVRRMQALEALTTIDIIVFDKTGTLTENRMAIGKIATDASLSEIQAVQIAALIAQNSLHPVSRALVEASKRYPIAKVNLDFVNVQEISGSGLTANSVYGNLKLGSAQFCALESAHTKQPHDDISKVHLVSERGWLASFEIVEAIKLDAISAIRTLQENNIKVEVLSGDRAESVKRIAAMVGIHGSFGNCTPQEKLTHIQLLQQQGHKVAMVGDGLNDGPVLASAHVSIAMGQAVPLAQAQSDFVVLGGQLASVPHLITQAKRTMRIVKQNLIWAATYNAICVPLAMLGLLPAWLAGLGMALSSLLVILNAARLSRAPLLEVT